ncbi:hypothetical protein SKAU_G00242140 [Synaphobranchus kaupii]|uniref:Uncharacterized protein n=1 Tax=Synaphobranchus kaupii TaxID=118154 RepID=A0A9Q1F7W3_SYNKA|nr:hypothetical protein SKAU_G00242140 [Synaphobranchus kaupii]
METGTERGPRADCLIRQKTLFGAQSMWNESGCLKRNVPLSVLQLGFLGRMWERLPQGRGRTCVSRVTLDPGPGTRRALSCISHPKKRQLTFKVETHPSSRSPLHDDVTGHFRNVLPETNKLTRAPAAACAMCVFVYAAVSVYRDSNIAAGDFLAPRGRAVVVHRRGKSSSALKYFGPHRNR